MNIVLFLIAFILLFVLPYIGLWKLFEKAGQSGWKALIPIFNYYVMLEICGRPKWWFLLLFIPALNIFIAVGITIDFIKSYGKTKFSDTLAAVILGFIYIPKWGFDPSTKYLGQSASPEFRDKYQKLLRKSSGQEWAEAIIFAVVAATLIRGLFIEAFTIPTPSMERSLLVGDFLFVSKVNYGARTPMTPVSFPFAHHTMPIFDVKSYWDGIKLPYYRLPGLSHVKKGDVVVFNYPMDADSPLYRPVDKRENYIKRCQGTPGDTLKLINTQVYINNKAAVTPPESQTSYLVRTNGQELNPQVLYDLHIDPSHGQVNATDLEWIMPRASVPILKSYSNITYIAPYIQPAGQADLQVFPHDTKLKWNVDNYGPIIIPKKGWTVKLDSTNYLIYERAIRLYENNKLEKRGNDIYINGAKTNQYTFKMDYYWMMGDNRHNSLDSRFWGFVPEDHIVGKALFVWMSWDEQGSFIHKIRWERLFMGIK